MRNGGNGIKESGNLYNLRSADKKKLQEIRKKIKRKLTGNNVETLTTKYTYIFYFGLWQ